MEELEELNTPLDVDESTVDIKEEPVDFVFFEVDSQPNLLCMACLCATRNTYTLSDDALKQYYMDIIWEFQLFTDNATELSPRLCWECVAVLRRLVHFRKQVKESYAILQPMLHMFGDTGLNDILQTSLCRPGRLNISVTESIDIQLGDDDDFGNRGSDVCSDEDGNSDQTPLVAVKEETDEDSVQALQEKIPTQTQSKHHKVATTSEKDFEAFLRQRRLQFIEDDDMNDEFSPNANSPDKNHTEQFVNTEIRARSRKYCDEHKANSETFLLEERLKTKESSNTGKIKLKRKNPLRLKRIRPFKCHRCSNSYYIKKYLLKHIALVHGERQFQCKECPRNLLYKSVFAAHMLQSHGFTSKNPKQNYGIQKSEHTGYTQDPAQNHHIEQIERTEQFANTDERAISEKYYSEQEANSDTLLLEERLKIKESTNTRKLRFKRKKPFQQHTEHIRPFKCHRCSKLFCSKKDLVQHIAIVHRESQFQCMECPKKFVYKSGFVSHVINLHGYNTKNPQQNYDIQKIKHTDHTQNLAQNDDTEQLERTEQFANTDELARSEKHNVEQEANSENSWHKEFKRSLQQKKEFEAFSRQHSFEFTKDDDMNGELSLNANSRDKNHTEQSVTTDELARSGKDNFEQLNSETLLLEERLKTKESSNTGKIEFEPKKPFQLENIGPFTCVWCSKSFFKKRGLIEHFARIHREKQFQCKKCPKKFVYKSSFASHVIKFHGRKTKNLAKNCVNKQLERTDNRVDQTKRVEEAAQTKRVEETAQTKRVEETAQTKRVEETAQTKRVEETANSETLWLEEFKRFNNEKMILKRFYTRAANYRGKNHTEQFVNTDERARSGSTTLNKKQTNNAETNRQNTKSSTKYQY